MRFWSKIKAGHVNGYACLLKMLNRAATTQRRTLRWMEQSYARHNLVSGRNRRARQNRECSSFLFKRFNASAEKSYCDCQACEEHDHAVSGANMKRSAESASFSSCRRVKGFMSWLCKNNTCELCRRGPDSPEVAVTSMRIAASQEGYGIWPLIFSGERRSETLSR